MRKRDNLLTREGEGAWGGAKSYDSEKAWTSINHSTLSDWDYMYVQKTCFEEVAMGSAKDDDGVPQCKGWGDFRIQERVKDRGSWGRLVLSGVSISLL
jgi:hypothetical protein